MTVKTPYSLHVFGWVQSQGKCSSASVGGLRGPVAENHKKHWACLLLNLSAEWHHNGTSEEISGGEFTPYKPYIALIDPEDPHISHI